MNIISGTIDFYINEPTAVSIGKFDGVHLGHRKILSLVTAKKKDGLLPAVFTFDPSPDELFSGSFAGSLITKKEKEELLESLGIELLIEFPMNEKTAAITPEDFLGDVLKDQLNARYLAAGEDVSFGRRGAGDARFLRENTPEIGIETEIVQKVMSRGETVSSTLIRTCLENGEMERVSELMSGPYCISGVVESGRQLGQKLGFPTLNMKPPLKKLLPPNGVYLSQTVIGDREYPGITNLGVKPTFGDGSPCVAETFLFDFDRDAYGRPAKVSFLHFVRPEMRFETPQALQDRVEQDIQDARGYFGE